MVDLKKAVHTKNFSYTNEDGTTETIKLLPLSGIFIPTLFRVAKHFQSMNKATTPEEISQRTLDLLTDDILRDLVDISVETIRKSITEASEEDIKNFVSSHLFELFPVIIELNLGNTKAK